jgi:D-cysteine desulfhydrase
VIHAHEPPRLQLAQLPTPLVELRNVAHELHLPQVLMKRDDLTGLETTGNKVRKLEYLVADALEQGADTLVSNGGYQSNHCRATAAVGARLGLRVRLILRSPQPQPGNDGNLFLTRLFGADVSFHTPEQYNSRRRELIESAMQSERDEGRKPYFFPVGGSVPLGSWGYIRCMHELAGQIGRDVKLDIFIALSSSGTVAGAIIGRALFDCSNWRVIGVPVSDSLEFFRNDLRQLMAATVDKYDLKLSESDTPIELLDGFIGEGYSIPTPAGLDALRMVARLEGVLLDPTYTSKAFAGFAHAIRSGGIRDGAVPVFVHTGGAFGLMAARAMLDGISS